MSAPENPGTSEGTDTKPKDKRHNRWCARECERSQMVTMHIQGAPL